MIETIGMNEIIILIIVAAFISAGSFYAGWSSYKKQMLLMFDNVLDELMIELSIEHHDNQYYLYYLDKKEFICQADDIESLAFKFNKTVGSEYIGHVVTTGYECNFVNGKIET